MKITVTTRKLSNRKPKTGIKAIVPKARVVNKADPSLLRVTRVMSETVVQWFQFAGWTVEGRLRYSKGGQCVGLTKGTEHVSVEDTGKFPWYLGDTTIRVGLVMTTFRDAPIELR